MTMRATVPARRFCPTRRRRPPVKGRPLPPVRLMHPRLVLLALAIGPLHALRGQAATPAPYESIVTERDLMIPTRDGARMATDIYRPARNGVAVNERFPVLLQRTPYARSAVAGEAEYFAQHGYVVEIGRASWRERV